MSMDHSLDGFTMMHKTTHDDRVQESLKSRRSAYVSRIARMHAMVSLCKKPGLSCPKTGVIMPQNRGGSSTANRLSLPKTFQSVSDQNAFN